MIQQADLRRQLGQPRLCRRNRPESAVGPTSWGSSALNKEPPRPCRRGTENVDSPSRGSVACVPSVHKPLAPPKCKGDWKTLF